MNLKKFDFPLPTKEEIASVRVLAENCPEELDGRELWICKNFLDGGFE
ncbi:hypothetical protein KJ660_03810 [Candidatus Micrarchaeota archaeon]|nr:hypothetical protein [Candidatus Micrarchaeota archaeon]